MVFDHWLNQMTIRDLRRIFPAMKLQAYRRRLVLPRKTVDVHCCFPHLSGGFGCPQTFSILSSHNVSLVSHLSSLFSFSFLFISVSLSLHLFSFISSLSLSPSPSLCLSPYDFVWCWCVLVVLCCVSACGVVVVWRLWCVFCVQCMWCHAEKSPKKNRV